MIVNGIYIQGGHGRQTDKIRNLRRFTEQWTEFADAEALEFGEDDAHYVSGVLHMGDLTLDSFHEMANALE